MRRRKQRESRNNRGREEIQSDLGANGQVGCSKQRYQPKEIISLSNRVVDPEFRWLAPSVRHEGSSW